MLSKIYPYSPKHVHIFHLPGILISYRIKALSFLEDHFSGTCKGCPQVTQKRPRKNLVLFLFAPIIPLIQSTHTVLRRGILTWPQPPKAPSQQHIANEQHYIEAAYPERTAVMRHKLKSRKSRFVIIRITSLSKTF